MSKEYRMLKKPWYIIPLFTLIPLIYIASGYEWYLILVMMLIYLLVGIFLYRQFIRLVAEIKDNTLYLYTGIGTSDPSSINLDSITSVERLTKKLLKINYGSNEACSIEAEKKILDQMEHDLSNLN